MQRARSILPLPVSAPKSDQARWFSEEVQPHEASLRSYLRGLFPTLPDIDDLVQESYIRLIRAKEANKITYVKAFLFATARNAALDIFRRRKVVSIDAIGDMAGLSVIEDRPDVGDAVSRQQELELLSEAVRSLPDRCRQVLTLRLLYGLSHKEIAANLGISEHTVKAQLAKGMRRCAEFFQQRGLVTPSQPQDAPLS
jgi:RNA polymerase sigma-70 factor (ECF subfamily)